MPGTRLDEKAIFNVARRIDSAEAREEYLRQVCGDDPTVADRIRTLLRGFARRPSFLEAPVAHIDVSVDTAASAKEIGAQIGPYLIREQIGEGGMGVVYVAEQTEPVRRKVALKIIKPGMATKDVIARFQAERQALAIMDHPNIATVFDGGVTGGSRDSRKADHDANSPENDSSNYARPANGWSLEEQDSAAGRPFFVMELVQGEPITDYCDQKRLDTKERLKLFLKVCRAVHHAHQKGIIHRDLKPSNILVPEIDGEAVPKVIDFGIAKAVDQKLTERTIYTRFSQMVGTPLYMSPEQVGRGVIDIDTRSDVYSLGVLLYELLTGSTPFSHEMIHQADEEEMRRIIREDQPRRPSAMVSTMAAEALSTIAQRRSSEPAKLSTALRGELDWLVLKALEKDRDRRYESASALAEDVERYLADEPVLAKPPSTAYRLQKFVRRNRVLAASLVAVFVALSLGVAVATFGFVQAIEQRDLAQRAEQDARELANLLSDMYPRPWGMKTLGRNHTVYDAIEEISPTLEQRLLNHPTVEVEVRQIFGDAYTTAGEFDKARDHYNKALARALDVYGEQHEAVAELHASLADEVGWNYEVPLDYADKLAHAEKAIEIYESLGIESPRLCSALFAKGHCLLQTSPERKAEAEEAQRRCVDGHRRIGDLPVIALWDLGLLLMDVGDDRLDDAEVELRNALGAYKAGESPLMHKATALSGLARCLRRKGDLAGAIDCFHESWELFRSDRDLKSEARGFYVGLRLVETYFAQGNIQEAFNQLNRVEEDLTQESAPAESRVDCLVVKGWLYYQLENNESAENVFKDSMTLAEDHLGNRVAIYRHSCGYLARTLALQGRSDDAAEQFRKHLPLTQGYVDQSHVNPIAHWYHARAILGSTENEDHEQLMTALDTASEGLDYVHRWTWEWFEPAFHQVIAGLQKRLGETDQAIESLELGLKKAVEPRATYCSFCLEVPTARRDLELMLANVHLENEDVDKARNVLQAGVQVREAALGDNHIQVALANLRLGGFLVAQSEFTTAEQPLLEAHQKLEPHPDVVNHLRYRVATNLVEVYTAMDQPEEALKWKTTSEKTRESANP